jgi:hypothetical protein
VSELEPLTISWTSQKLVVTTKIFYLPQYALPFPRRVRTTMFPFPWQRNLLDMIRCDPLFVPLATWVRHVTRQGSHLGGEVIHHAPLHGADIQHSALQNGTPVSRNVFPNSVLQTWEDSAGTRGMSDSKTACLGGRTHVSDSIFS